MSLPLLILAVVGAVNAPRIRPALARAGTARWTVAAAGLGLALAAVVGVAAASGPFLDGIDVSPEAWRVAAGVVLLAAGVRVVVSPRAAAEPGLAGYGAALIPVAFPLLLTPELVMLGVSAGADLGTATTSLAAAIALAGVAVIPYERFPATVAAAAARFHGAFVVVGGLALIVEGIRDI